MWQSGKAIKRKRHGVRPRLRLTASFLYICTTLRKSLNGFDVSMSYRLSNNIVSSINFMYSSKILFVRSINSFSRSSTTEQSINTVYVWRIQFVYCLFKIKLICSLPFKSPMKFLYIPWGCKQHKPWNCCYLFLFFKIWQI